MSLNRELVFLIIHYLHEEGYSETAHMLEYESGVYFDARHFENKVLSGDWDGAERYISGFTKVHDSKYATKIYFEIRKQKFLEALDSNDHGKALDILVKDLKVFAPGHEALYKEMTELLTLNNIRENASLAMYQDTASARKVMLAELTKVINADPIFRGKLEFPDVSRQRLRRLINQSLNWQHLLCQYPQPDPHVGTLYVDHVCPLLGNQFPSPQSSQTISTSASLESTDSIVTHSAISNGASSCAIPTNPDGPEGADIVSQMRYLETSNERILNMAQPSQNLFYISNALLNSTQPASSVLNIPVGNPAPVCPFSIPADLPPIIHPDQSVNLVRDDLPNSPPNDHVFENYKPKQYFDLPKMVARVFYEDSSPTSMDFHPFQQTFLLVGTNTGDIGLWEVSSGKKLLSRNFEIWDIEECSVLLETALFMDPCVSVNRIAWSPEGSLFGVAYARHIVQIYSYHGSNDVRQLMEIDAHVGSVNDLAFSIPEDQILVITCGDDKTVKVWDATTGIKMNTFEGHDAPVHSLCPHSKLNIHFIFSTSVDGNIKVWLYDEMVPRVNYDTPGLGCTSMAYSADDNRLFSCGTNIDGESFLVEWDEGEGSLKRIYHGLQKNSSDVVQFDILKNNFLAAGDEHVIKIWDMDNIQVQTVIDAGDLPARPLIRFNKDGILLAAFSNENGIKILASDSGHRLLKTFQNCSFDSPTIHPDASKLVIDTISTASATELAYEVAAKGNGEEENSEVKDVSNDGKLFEISRPSQCQTLWLPPHVKVDKIARLSYNNTGNGILALASSAVHLFWRWSHTDLNPSGTATTRVSPILWHPKSSSWLMTNELCLDTEVDVSCFALSKNDSYLLSASGGIVSLYNLLTFKTMLSIMPTPPVTTCLAFHPQDNNIIAFGMDDSTIVIYHFRQKRIISKLVGHSDRVSGLAFSNSLDVLVSSGADRQIFVWSFEGWKKQRNTSLQIPHEKGHAASADTYIQFHQDQTQFLAVHETHLAIYDARTLDCVKQWTPGEEVAPISSATFSCDGQIVYACFEDGSVSIFDVPNLELYCQITSAAYLSPGSSFEVYPVAIAAHPHEPSQFAMGLTDGRAVIFEPSSSAGKWSMPPPDDNGSASSSSTPVGCNGNFSNSISV